MQQHERFETVVIGGGQAGLAVGYLLKQQGRSFVILDASERIGDSWRQRWDSLKLYSPASRDGLPGMRFPARRTAYPTMDEMADYLEAYAARFELPVRSGAAVDALEIEGGRYVASSGDRRFEADNVVVATGVFQKPHIPAFASELDPGITQLHSNAYRNLSQLQKGPVLVVGASHSGSDIAFEAASKHEVVLSGKDTGQLPAPVESRRGRFLFRAAVLRRHACPDGGHATWPQDARACPARRRTAASVQTRGPAGGRRRARPRTNGCRRERAARAGRRARARRQERRVVHGLPSTVLNGKTLPMAGFSVSRPVSRILSWVTISLGRRLPDGSSGVPGSSAGRVIGTCFALHRTGFG